MSRYPYMLLVLVLAVATAGAQVLCACPTVAAATMPPQACVGEGDCCSKAAPNPRPVEDNEPCDHCNLKHRMPQMMADAPSVVSALAPALDVPPIPTAIAICNDLTSVQQRLQDGVPTPPLLQDLFSAHTLLLI